ncbi:MAG: hypothetical protein H0V89_03760, partial [Deltaproteobacteria bacterium]|nr:hypothetical protein [Deltaproteobacteria bacterium]
AVDLDALTAYGEAPFTLDQDAPVLVSELDRIGDLGTLGPAQQRFLRVVGIVPPGKVYMLTGSPELGSSTAGTPATADIYELSSLDDGEPWSFEKIGDLKGTTNPPARVSAAASSVLVGDTPMILVTGGRENFWVIGPSHDDWFLWDPATQEIADKGRLTEGRSEHFHVPLANGTVLVAGGWATNEGGGVVTNFADLIDPTRGTVEEIDLDLPGDSGSNGASLGADGALVCGGFATSFDLAGTPLATSVSDCVIVNFQGVSRPAAALPIPLAKFAMAAAGEGKVLVAGGINWDGTKDANQRFSAVNQAFLYDAGPDTWTAVSPLNDARSAAVGISLANGRVLVVGGASQDGVYQLPDGEVGCPEVYTPGNQRFARLDDQCGSWGAGAAPPVAQWPGLGTVLLKGYTVQEDPQDAVGFLGAAPAIGQ